MYGADYSGLNYNSTQWNSPDSMNASHWKAAMEECREYCESDPSCCTWTYITPELDPDGETCNLNYGIPTLIADNATATHWTGASYVRANSSQCMDNPLGPLYPGPQWSHPQIHNSPNCLHLFGWHDLTGTIYLNGTYHVFQGCPGPGSLSGGWMHSVSTDLVHWTHSGIDISSIMEPYGESTPCSGFVTVDDDGIVCAGLRQCIGNWPNMSGNLNAVPLELRCAVNADLSVWSGPEYMLWFYYNRSIPYDPPRPWRGTDGTWYTAISADACNSTGYTCDGGGRAYLYSSPFMRGPRANWQQAGILFESNFTVLTPYTGQAMNREFVTSDYIGNLTGDPNRGNTRIYMNNVCDDRQNDPHDSYGGCCDCTSGWFLGYQATDTSPFVVDYEQANSTGMFDYGSFFSNSTCAALAEAGRKESRQPTDAASAREAARRRLSGCIGMAGLYNAAGTGQFRMARTISTGSDDQVRGPAGRHIILSWVGEPASALQSLPRDLSLATDGSGMLQQFVPELKMLRINGSSDQLRVNSPAPVIAPVSVAGAALQPDRLRSRLQTQQFELTCTFTVSPDADPYIVFGLNVLMSYDGQDLIPIGVSWPLQQVYVGSRAGPLYDAPLSIEAGSVPGDASLHSNVAEHVARSSIAAGPRTIWVHAIVDRQVITVIFNNRTAITAIQVPRDENSTLIEMFGVDGQDVTATMDVWALSSAANN